MRPRARARNLVGIPYLILLSAIGCAQPTTDAGRPDGDDSLRAALYETLWVAYAPTNFFPDRRPPVIPSEESVRQDLRTLRGVGFDGLITYGMDIPELARLAREEGFRHL